MSNLFLVLHTNLPKIQLKWQESQCIGQSFVEMLLAADGNAKFDILLPKMKLELVFVHGPVPKLDNPLHNYIATIVLTKSAEDSFLKTGLLWPSSSLAIWSMRLLLSLSRSYSYSIAPR
jgi:hypothetical protein